MKVCTNDFWRLAKETDTSSLEDQSTELVEFLDECTTESNAKQNSLKWLEILLDRKHQCCARYFWNVCT